MSHPLPTPLLRRVFLLGCFLIALPVFFACSGGGDNASPPAPSGGSGQGGGGSRPGNGAVADNWTTNGVVNDIALSSDGGTVYIGGSFTAVGAPAPNFVSLDAETGVPASGFPRVNGNGSVNASCSDGAGGWFIGGTFTRVGTMARRNIAHILSNGTVDPVWDPNADGGSVSVLALSGSTLYVGGAFRGIGGQTRNNLAALDAATGVATAWNPNPDASVSKLLVSGQTLYVTGGFLHVGGQARRGLAALDAVTGMATDWNPNTSNTDGPVNVVAVSGDIVYVGGGFRTIGGQARTSLAAVDRISGVATSWNPNVVASDGSPAIFELELVGQTVYVSGDFSQIGGQPRNTIAALEPNTGAPTLWNPNPDAQARILAAVGNTLYVSGDFTAIGGQRRQGLAAVDAVTGVPTAWNPGAIGVSTLTVFGRSVAVGGGVVLTSGERRGNLAAIDTTTGRLTPWNPVAQGEVLALALSGQTVYVGGRFQSINGQPRFHLAALEATNGLLTFWNPSVQGDAQGIELPFVLDLATSGSIVYVGGQFHQLGAQPRRSLGSVDMATGQATNWNPNVAGLVTAMAISGSAMYVGGRFAAIGGQPRSNIAAVDTESGLTTTWNPGANGQVASLAVSDRAIYVGGGFLFDGGFTAIGGQARNALAAIDAATGVVTAWNPAPELEASPNISRGITSLAVSGSTVYIGGEFREIGGQPRRNLAAVDATTALATTWQADLAVGSVNALAVLGNTLIAGGGFTEPKPHLAFLSRTP